MKVLIIILLLIILFLALVNILDAAISRAEKVECLTWQQYATEYPLFYLTQWQKEQCDHYGIIINAPVK